MNSKIIGSVVIVLIIAGGSFYGGMAYAKNNSTVSFRSGSSNGQLTAGLGNRTGGSFGRTNGGFVAGEILSKDATSITVKMQDGSTKIVLVSKSTQVQKSISGTLEDLSIGTNVTVTGSANNDGSVTAQSVQIRPAGVTPIGRQIQTNQ